MPAPPLALTDSQISAIMALARPLSPDQRSRFLELLAAKLNGQRELGDGAIYRLCRDLQRQLFSPPINRGRPRIDDHEDDERPRRRRADGIAAQVSS
jgi:hypothetical protein